MSGGPIGITIIGDPKGKAEILRELAKRQSPQLTTTLSKVTRSAALAALPFIKAEAPAPTPGVARSRGTGATRNSVTIGQLRRDAGYSVGPRIWRRHFNIKGTKTGMKPNPWVLRGVNKAKVAVRTTAGLRMKAEVRR